MTPDVNLLVAAMREDHPHHGLAFHHVQQQLQLVHVELHTALQVLQSRQLLFLQQLHLSRLIRQRLLEHQLQQFSTQQQYVRQTAPLQVLEFFVHLLAELEIYSLTESHHL